MEFEKGDAVITAYGAGFVSSIGKKDDMYPIVVNVDGVLRDFTADAKEFSEQLYPTLFHRGKHPEQWDTDLQRFVFDFDIGAFIDNKTRSVLTHHEVAQILNKGLKDGV